MSDRPDEAQEQTDAQHGAHPSVDIAKYSTICAAYKLTFKDDPFREGALYTDLKNRCTERLHPITQSICLDNYIESIEYNG